MSSEVSVLLRKPGKSLYPQRTHNSGWPVSICREQYTIKYEGLNVMLVITCAISFKYWIRMLITNSKSNVTWIDSNDNSQHQVSLRNAGFKHIICQVKNNLFVMRFIVKSQNIDYSMHILIFLFIFFLS